MKSVNQLGRLSQVATYKGWNAISYSSAVRTYGRKGIEVSEKKRKGIILILLLTALISNIFYIDTADAGKARKFIGKSKFGNPTLFKKDQKFVGVGYVSGWAGGGDVTGQYFLYDDVSVQAHYAMLGYDYGYGTAKVNYLSAAAVYHQKIDTDYGWYGGLGFAVGEATWEDDRYFTKTSHSYNLGGLYWTGGLEMFFSKDLLVNAGYAVTGLGLGVNYKF